LTWACCRRSSATVTAYPSPQAAAQHFGISCRAPGCAGAQHWRRTASHIDGAALRNEHVDEADATLKMLRVHLEDVPIDILKEAIRAYCNAPGKRFFPRSAGEPREFEECLGAKILRRAASVQLGF